MVFNKEEPKKYKAGDPNKPDYKEFKPNKGLDRYER